MLNIKALEKKFGEISVLKGIDLEVQKGEVISIIGPSGSGKSTFLRCLNFLEVADGGSMIFLGHKYDLHRSSHSEILSVRQHMGMVFQSFNLFSHQTVRGNVMEALMTVKKKTKAQAFAISEKYLDLVGLQEKSDAYPAQLSGGQQQRVAIARSLALEPEVLLLDEPTSALDPELVNEVLSVIKKVAETGVTMIIVTHEMRFAFEISDQIVFIECGRIVEKGQPKQMREQPQEFRTKQFLGQFFMTSDYSI